MYISEGGGQAHRKKKTIAGWKIDGSNKLRDVQSIMSEQFWHVLATSRCIYHTRKNATPNGSCWKLRRTHWNRHCCLATMPPMVHLARQQIMRTKGNKVGILDRSWLSLVHMAWWDMKSELTRMFNRYQGGRCRMMEVEYLIGIDMIWVYLIVLVCFAIVIHWCPLHPIGFHCIVCFEATIGLAINASTVWSRQGAPWKNKRLMSRRRGTSSH